MYDVTRRGSLGNGVYCEKTPSYRARADNKWHACSQVKHEQKGGFTFPHRSAMI